MTYFRRYRLAHLAREITQARDQGDFARADQLDRKRYFILTGRDTTRA